MNIFKQLFSKKEEPQCAMPVVRHSAEFGEHPLDFEHRCCFWEQIKDIGAGTKSGNGEKVKVEMQSGNIAVYCLWSERYNVFQEGGQRNWKYLFMGYM